jgi:hypothetical protein
MTDTTTSDARPIFPDNSSAGYDWVCHSAIAYAAALWELDPYDPVDELAISQRFSMWISKLHAHADRHLPADYDPLDGRPF